MRNKMFFLGLFLFVGINSMAEPTGDSSGAAYYRMVESQIKDWEVKINQVSEKGSLELERAMKVEDVYTARLGLLQSKMEIIQIKLKALKASENDHKQWSQLRDEVDQSWDEMNQTLKTIEEKQLYEAKFETKMDKFELIMEELEHKISDTQGELKHTYEKVREELKTQNDIFLKSFSEFRKSSSTQMDNIKINLEKSLDETERILSKYREKLIPIYKDIITKNYEKLKKEMNQLPDKLEKDYKDFMKDIESSQEYKKTQEVVDEVIKKAREAGNSIIHQLK